MSQPKPKPKKCGYENLPQVRASFAAQEFGCPLDHCPCGTHDAEQKEHQCPPPRERTEREIEIEEALGSLRRYE